METILLAAVASLLIPLAMFLVRRWIEKRRGEDLTKLIEGIKVTLDMLEKQKVTVLTHSESLANRLRWWEEAYSNIRSCSWTLEEMNNSFVECCSLMRKIGYDTDFVEFFAKTWLYPKRDAMLKARR